MSFVNDRACGCEPCPINLDAHAFKTEWEDPFFAGKQCGWHKQIRGKHGCISPDIVINAEEHIYVQFYKSRLRVDRRNVCVWEGLEIVESITKDELSNEFLVSLNDTIFTVPLLELSHWASLIGGKRK